MQRADAVFEGGGVKGIGLVGALKAFEDAEFKWQNVAGASAGAITAALVAVDYKASELKEIMDTRMDFRKIMDKAGIGKLPYIGPWLSLIIYKGMFQGDYFLKLMRELLAEKTGKEKITFGDLIIPKDPEDSEEDYQKKYKYKLRIVASDISSNELLILPQDIERLGCDPDDLEVALAVRMSMSIPYFFKPVRFREGKQRQHRHWIVDGGMLSNFPIWLFDSPSGQLPAWPTIGFLLWEPGSEKPRHTRIRGLVSMTWAMAKTMMTAHDRKAIEEADVNRIVKIPTGKYATTDFDLTKEDREWLHNSGHQAAGEYLKTWDFNQYTASRMQRVV